jgi:pilin isopeptide linkage protein/LPXTG-motif cell wall-anchored protein
MMPIKSKKHIIFAKAVCLAGGLVIALSAFMTSGYAWHGAVSKENVFSGVQPAGYSAVLYKYERNADDGKTTIPIPGAAFDLYEAAGAERLRIGGQYFTGLDGKIAVHDLKSGDYVFVESQPSYGYTYDKTEDGHRITEYFFSVEKGSSDGSARVTAYNLRTTGGLTYNPIVEKKLTGILPGRKVDFTFQLAAIGGSPMPSETKNKTKTMTIHGAGEGAFGAIFYEEAGTYQYTIVEERGLEKGYSYDPSSYTLTVVVKQNDAALKVESAVYAKSGDTSQYTKAVFVNRYHEENPDQTTSVTVFKKWRGDAPHPNSVQVRLYGDGRVFAEPVTLSKDNGWTYTWTGLEKGMKWTVDEPEVPGGYTKTIAGGALEGFTITNTNTEADKTPDSATVHINGMKTWEHKGNPDANHPQNITVLIMNGDEVVIQKLVSAADDWQWSFTLPRFDHSGSEIPYTVDEAVVYGYRKAVEGYNLTNTYIPPEPPDLETDLQDPSVPLFPGPATGDDANIALWVILLLISVVALLLLRRKMTRD